MHPYISGLYVVRVGDICLKLCWLLFLAKVAKIKIEIINLFSVVQRPSSVHPCIEMCDRSVVTVYVIQINWGFQRKLPSFLGRRGGQDLRWYHPRF